MPTNPTCLENVVSRESAYGRGQWPHSQIDHHKHEVSMMHDLMGRMTDMERAERIASHYLSHAANAQYMLKIIEMNRYNPDPSPEAEACIKIMADEIIRNHGYDLGVELAWPNPRQ